MAIEVGQKVTGKVTGITNFGAFVDIGESSNGLVHISEISNSFIRNINDVLSVGDDVTALVTKIEDDGKIALSIRQAEVREPKKAPREQQREPKRYPKSKAPSFKTQRQDTNDFDAMMSNFIKDSDDRLASLKRNIEGKRGGRGGRRS